MRSISSVKEVRVTPSKICAKLLLLVTIRSRMDQIGEFEISVDPVRDSPDAILTFSSLDSRHTL
eukprot:scaffold157561_cov24-Attheya_sp.AAC.1